MKLRLLGAVCACVFTLFTLPGQAALISVLGGQAVYDSDLDVTWMGDANLAKTSGFDADGKMSIASAQTWVGGLTVGGFLDWRLPTTLVPDASCTDDTAGSTPSADPAGYNCTGSELGHLFYNELGGTAGSSILSSGDPNLLLFTNIQTAVYWSGTGSGPSSPHWSLRFSTGFQKTFGSSNVLLSWAVRDGGSELVPSVPIPSAVWLFGSGLLGLVSMARRKKV